MSANKPSGAANRKRQLQFKQENEKSAKVFTKYFQVESKQSEEIGCSLSLVGSNSFLDEKMEETPEESSLKTTSQSPSSTTTGDVQIDINDPALWPVPLNSKIRDHIIYVGIDVESHLTNVIEFPRDHYNRCFSKSLLYRKLNNGESYLRTWLLYSASSDKVFCVCCKLYYSDKTKSSLATVGINNWKHITEYLKSHENSPEHLKCFVNWFEASRRLKTNKTIDKNLQSLIIRERDHWRLVLDRMCNIILYLSKNNLSFRGSSDRLFTPQNGNFLGLVELLSKYDATLNEHLRRISSKESHVTYCGKTIQNELISLLASGIKDSILRRARDAKYFSIILDCTRDVSHTEQLSFTLRFVDISSDEIEIKEHFLTYQTVEKSTGQSIFQILQKLLEDVNLNLMNCRGQGYDNGANMKGKNKGVQARVCELNPRAFFMPCGCHSLNLVISDCATSCTESISFFGIVQRIYTLFSASVSRWNILKDHVSNFTVKPLCETRWESRIECLKPIRYQIVEIYDALVTLSETDSSDISIKHEAYTLSEQISTFSFLVMLVTWYNILYRVNIVSKSMQSAAMDIASVVSLMKSCTEFVTEYRVTGFENSLVDAKELAESLEVEPIFIEKRLRRKKQMFAYESRDEIVISPKNNFKNNVFNVILDNAIASLQERFQQLNEFHQTWGILYNLKKLPADNDLLKFCKDLHLKLKMENNCDINGAELFDELKSASTLLPKDILGPLNVLNFIKSSGLQNVVPNIWISLRIMLTIPVTVASGERSFSKLKLIKNYLRSTMSDERLNNLAILSIEKEIATQLDITEIIKNFADLKARKINF